jgi:hypothetical protein
MKTDKMLLTDEQIKDITGVDPKLMAILRVLLQAQVAKVLKVLAETTDEEIMLTDEELKIIIGLGPDDNAYAWETAVKASGTQTIKCQRIYQARRSRAILG